SAPDFRGGSLRRCIPRGRRLLVMLRRTRVAPTRLTKVCDGGDNTQRNHHQSELNPSLRAATRRARRKRWVQSPSERTGQKRSVRSEQSSRLFCTAFALLAKCCERGFGLCEIPGGCCRGDGNPRTLVELPW